MQKVLFSNGIELLSHQNGILVTQGDVSYVARGWQLTPAVVELVYTALSHGFHHMIQEGHPQQANRWPNQQGVAYLSFAPDPALQWSFAIDTFKGDDYGHAVFNGKYHTDFVAAGLPFTFEKRNEQARHLVVSHAHVLQTIERIARFDHSITAHLRS